MKKVLFIAGVALALVGCLPQQSSDTGVQSGSDRGSSGALTNQGPSGSGSSTNDTNQSSSSSQTQPSQP
jgi:hypothetical protein